MTIYKDKHGRVINFYFNSCRLIPSIYRHPFFSFRWLFITFCVDLNKIGENGKVN